MIDSESKRRQLAGIFSAILFLFFIQQLTMLVESIYMLNLLNTQMDIRAAGILFLLLPVLLFFLKHSKRTYTVILGLMLICMLISTLLPTTLRIFSAGIGAGLFLVYLPLQLSDSNFIKISWGQSAAIATLASILFRISGRTIDISISGSTVFIAWLLILVVGILFYMEMRYNPGLAASDESDGGKNETGSLLNLWLSTMGLAACIIFIYFTFSSPGVMVRWTQGDYTLTHILLTIFILVAVFFNPATILSKNSSKIFLLVWNGLFLFFFVWNILLHQIDFPSLDKITPVTVGSNGPMSTLVYYQMLIFSPVIFMNIRWFTCAIGMAKPKAIALPQLLSALLIIICIFMHIFTNTWGYVGAVSSVFRNQFHVPFVVAGVFILLPLIHSSLIGKNVNPIFLHGSIFRVLAVSLALLSCGIVLFDRKGLTVSNDKKIDALTLMTYNIQQGVDLFGNKNFESQLARIKEINPDILCLQESDASRISGGNSDVVYYFASHLGYNSYYGPKTVTGTYGTAILSRVPLKNRRTIFTYSSKDEIGTAIAELTLGDKEITIINSHPAGNKKSRQEHIDMLVSLAEDKGYVIAMGDYNFRQDSPYYEKVTNTLQDAWLSIYPDAIGLVDTEMLNNDYKERKASSGVLLPGGKIDMKERIDHIFLSDSFVVKSANYLPAPESETDHPLHWAVIQFRE